MSRVFHSEQIQVLPFPWTHVSTNWALNSITGERVPLGQILARYNMIRQTPVWRQSAIIQSGRPRGYMTQQPQPASLPPSQQLPTWRQPVPSAPAPLPLHQFTAPSPLMYTHQPVLQPPPAPRTGVQHYRTPTPMSMPTPSSIHPPSLQARGADRQPQPHRHRHRHREPQPAQTPTAIDLTISTGEPSAITPTHSENSPPSSAPESVLTPDRPTQGRDDDAYFVRLLRPVEEFNRRWDRVREEDAREVESEGKGEEVGDEVYGYLGSWWARARWRGG